MARVKITDLPKDLKISSEESRKIRGGAYSSITAVRTSFYGSTTYGTVDYQSAASSVVAEFDSSGYQGEIIGGGGSGCDDGSSGSGAFGGG